MGDAKAPPEPHSCASFGDNDRTDEEHKPIIRIEQVNSMAGEPTKAAEEDVQSVESFHASSPGARAKGIATMCRHFQFLYLCAKPDI